MSGSTAATTPRRGTLFRSAAAAGLLGFAFDPDDGEDQDGPHGSADYGWAQPPRGRIRRKFNDGAHIKLSLDAARTRVRRRHLIIQSRTWLTAS